MEQNQELANNRMADLEKLQQELQEAVRESEKLKVQQHPPLREYKTIRCAFCYVSLTKEMLTIQTVISQMSCQG